MAWIPQPGLCNLRVEGEQAGSVGPEQSSDNAGVGWGHGGFGGAERWRVDAEVPVTALSGEFKAGLCFQGLPTAPLDPPTSM